MPVPVAMAAVSMGISAMQAWGQYQTGQEARNYSIRSAEALQQQAKYDVFSAGEKVSQDDYRASHLIARMQSVAAASGVDPTSGSPALTTIDSAEQAKLNDMYTAYAGKVQGQALDYQGTLLKVQGEEEEQSDTFGAITGLISGGINAAQMGGVGKPGGFGGTGFGASGGSGSSSSFGGYSVP